MASTHSAGTMPSTAQPIAPSHRTNSSEEMAEKSTTDIEKDATMSGQSAMDRLSSDDLDREIQLEGGIEGREDLRVVPSRPHSEKDLKKINSVSNVASIPNGGLQAWLQVAGAFVLFFNTWGILNTFGVYQTFYETDFLSTSSPSTISWVGSVQAFLLLIVGVVTGPIYDGGHFKILLYTGAFLVVFGHMMLSLCTQYYQVLLAQAFCIGIGAGCLFIPSVAILSTYFNSKLPLATGLAASGSSLGGVIYPIALYRLIPQVGFGWAVRILGFLSLAMFMVPIFCMKVRVLPGKKRPLIDWSAFKELPFMLFAVGGIPGFMGLYAPLFYIQYYAISTGITDVDLGFYLIAILNAASVFGRILPNILALRFGPFNTFIPGVIVTAILIYCAIPLQSAGSIIVWTLLFGFFSGSFVSLPPTIVVHMTKNRALIGTRLGMVFAFVSIGTLIGSPIAGVVLDARGFASVWIYGGSVAMGGALFFILARGLQYGWSPTTKC